MYVCVYLYVLFSSVGCPYSVDCFFWMQKLCSLTRSLLSVFCLCFLCCWNLIQKSHCPLQCPEVSIMFSFSSFSFRSYIEVFNSILTWCFVHGERPWSSFTLMCIPIWFSQYHVLGRLSFFQCVFLTERSLPLTSIFCEPITWPVCASWSFTIKICTLGRCRGSLG